MPRVVDTVDFERPIKKIIIPDDHRHPGDDWRRFDALGNLIVAEQPDVIVFLGDSADMASLCSYDNGKKSMVFKNVKEDIESYHEGERHIFAAMNKYNMSLGKVKKKQYRPLIVKLRGNHEQRVQRLLDYEPKWAGSVSMDDFRTRQMHTEVVVDYQDFIVLNGVCYSHYFASGVKGNPFSSARAMIMKRGMSCTMGHVHTLDHAVLTKVTGEMIRGLFAGSFHDPEYESFAGVQVDNQWWNGVILKHETQHGDYDMEEIKVERLLKNYL